MRHSGNSFILAIMLYGLAEKAYKSANETKGSHLIDLKPTTITMYITDDQGVSIGSWIKPKQTDRTVRFLGNFEYYN